MQYDNLPEVIREQDSLCLWKRTKRNGEWTKVPYQINGRRARADDPSTFTTYDRVAAVYAKGGYDGIGLLNKAFVGIDNVICSEEEKMFKIIDFGVSAFLDTENHTQLTKTGEHIAGGNFIDPLLQQNPKLRDERSDIYSVGAIWYYLLCGRAPSGSDMREYLEKSNAHLTESNVNTVMKCLSSDINNRYSSCEELLSIVKKEIKMGSQDGNI